MRLLSQVIDLLLDKAGQKYGHREEHLSVTKSGLLSKEVVSSWPNSKLALLLLSIWTYVKFEPDKIKLFRKLCSLQVPIVQAYMLFQQLCTKKFKS